MLTDVPEFDRGTTTSETTIVLRAISIALRTSSFIGTLESLGLLGQASVCTVTEPLVLTWKQVFLEAAEPAIPMVQIKEFPEPLARKFFERTEGLMRWSAAE